jgi:uncharacterized SAM-binding protein YcdF (DUF218 family)
MHAPKWLRWLVGVALALIAIWIGTIGLILLSGARPNPEKADAILVLGAAQWNGKPSPVLKARLDHAIELHRKEYAPWLIVTGGVGRGDTVSEGEVAMRYAERAGIPAAKILVERAGLTTKESVAAAVALMETHGLKSAILVTDSYHMMRAGLLARRAGIETFRAPTPNSPIDRAPSQRWHYVLRESMLLPATFVLVW